MAKTVAARPTLSAVVDKQLRRVTRKEIRGLVKTIRTDQKNFREVRDGILQLLVKRGYTWKSLFGTTQGLVAMTPRGGGK